MLAGDDGGDLRVIRLMVSGKVVSISVVGVSKIRYCGSCFANFGSEK